MKIQSNKIGLLAIGIMAIVSGTASAIESFCCNCGYSNGTEARSVFIDISETDIQGANDQCESECETTRPEGFDTYASYATAGECSN